MVKYLFDIINKNNFSTKREAQATVTLKGIRSDLRTFPHLHLRHKVLDAIRLIKRTLK